MKPLVIPLLSDGPRDDTTFQEAIKVVKLKQIYAFTTFNGKRNSGRVERYFVHSRSSSYRNIVLLFCTICFSIGVTLAVYFGYRAIQDFGLTLRLETISSLHERVTSSLALHFIDPYLDSRLIVRLLSPPNPVLAVSQSTAATLTSFFQGAAESSSASAYWWDRIRRDNFCVGLTMTPSERTPSSFCSATARAYTRGRQTSAARTRRSPRTGQCRWGRSGT
jgi:hypothetical protein